MTTPSSTPLLLSILVAGAAHAATLTGNAGATSPGTVTVIRASGGYATDATAAGAYTLALPDGWSGWVVPQRVESGKTVPFAPNAVSFTNLGGTRTQNFAKVGGIYQVREVIGTAQTPSGRRLADVLVTASSSGGADLTATSGTYRLGVPTRVIAPWSGSVTAQCPGYAFSPAAWTHTGIPPSDAPLQDDFTGYPTNARLNKVIFSRQQSLVDWDIWLLDRQTGAEERLLDSDTSDRFPRFDAEGTNVVFVREGNVMRMDAWARQVVNLTTGSVVAGRCLSARFSRDGRRLCFDALALTNGAVHGDLWIMDSDGGNKRPVLDSSDDDRSPAFSPDGRWLAFSRVASPATGPICAVEIDNPTNVVALTRSTDWNATPVYSADGALVYFRHGVPQPVPTQIYRVSLAEAGTNAAGWFVSATPAAVNQAPDCSVEASGNAVVYSSISGFESSEIYIMNQEVPTTGGRRLTHNFAIDADPGLGPSVLTGSGGGALLMPDNLDFGQLAIGASTSLTLTVSVSPLQPLAQVTLLPGHSLEQWPPGFSASTSGLPATVTLLAPFNLTVSYHPVSNGLHRGILTLPVSNDAVSAYYVDLAGRTATGGGIATNPLPAVATNRIVWSRQETANNRDLWIMNLDGSDQQRLLDTPETYMDQLPDVSASGRRVLFTRVRGIEPFVTRDLYIMNADGTGVASLTDDMDEAASAGRFRPDGGQIVFERAFVPTNEILPRTGLALMATNGGSKSFILDTATNRVEGERPAFSADGRWVVFQRPGLLPGSCGLFRVAAAGGDPVRMTLDGNDNERPAVSPDGRLVLCKHQPNGPTASSTNLGVVSFLQRDGGPAAVTVLTNTTGFSEISGNYTRDASNIVFAASPATGAATEICTVRADGSGLSVLTANEVADDDPACSPAFGAPVTVWVTASTRADGSGSVAPDGLLLVPYGGSTTVVATGAAHYHVSAVRTNGLQVATPNAAVYSHDWANLKGGEELAAAFAANLVTNGVPCWWLAQYGLGTNNAAALANSDSDGSPNWAEFYARTDPTNGASVLRILALMPAAAGAVAIEWPSVTGVVYAVQRAASLPPAGWATVPDASNRPGTGGVVAYTNVTSGAATRFYRVRVVVP
jgi:Tol biopolymer transport system component